MKYTTKKTTGAAERTLTSAVRAAEAARDEAAASAAAAFTERGLMQDLGEEVLGQMKLALVVAVASALLAMGTVVFALVHV